MYSYVQCGKIGLIDAGDSKTAGAHIILYIIGIDFITQFQMKLVGPSFLVTRIHPAKSIRFE